jgi:uncharacterized protein YlxW (UPF0749 family)
MIEYDEIESVQRRLMDSNTQMQDQLNKLESKISVLEDKLKEFRNLMPYMVSYELLEHIKKDKVRAYVGLEIKDD